MAFSIRVVEATEVYTKIGENVEDEFISKA
jgi:hypothetical protein